MKYLVFFILLLLILACDPFYIKKTAGISKMSIDVSSATVIQGDELTFEIKNTNSDVEVDLIGSGGVVQSFGLLGNGTHKKTIKLNTESGSYYLRISDEFLFKESNSFYVSGVQLLGGAGYENIAALQINPQDGVDLIVNTDSEAINNVYGANKKQSYLFSYDSFGLPAYTERFKGNCYLQIKCDANDPSLSGRYSITVRDASAIEGGALAFLYEFDNPFDNVRELYYSNSDVYSSDQYKPNSILLNNILDPASDGLAMHAIDSGSFIYSKKASSASLYIIMHRNDGGTDSFQIRTQQALNFNIANFHATSDALYFIAINSSGEAELHKIPFDSTKGVSDIFQQPAPTDTHLISFYETPDRSYYIQLIDDKLIHFAYGSSQGDLHTLSIEVYQLDTMDLIASTEWSNGNDFLINGASITGNELYFYGSYLGGYSRYEHNGLLTDLIPIEDQYVVGRTAGFIVKCLININDSTIVPDTQFGRGGFIFIDGTSDDTVSKMVKAASGVIFAAGKTASNHFINQNNAIPFGGLYDAFLYSIRD